MKVWDLPTRLFHWSIVFLVGFSWWSAEAGRMEWHYRSGVAALVAILFRVIWGFIGGSTARFTCFLRSPAAVIAYLREPKGAPEVAGHNPLGGYSVLALLLTLATQVGTGLFAVDVDGIESGPLSYLVSFEQGRSAAGVHHLSFTALQLLVALHLLAIVYYRIRGRGLTVPMITGRDHQVPRDGGEVMGDDSVRAVLVLVVALGIGWWISAGAPL